MDAIDLEKFNDAVALAQAGKKQEAYQRLKALTLRNLKDSNLWLWLAFTSPDAVESRKAIRQAISIDPANPNLQAAKEWFDKERRKDLPIENNTTAKSPPAPDFKSAGFNSNTYSYQAPPQTNAYYYPPQQSYYSQQMPNGSFNHQNQFYPNPTPIINPQEVMSSGAIFGFWCVYFVLFLVMTVAVIVVSYYFSPVQATFNYPYYSYEKTGDFVIPAIWCLVILTSIWGILDAGKRRSKFGPQLNDSGINVFIYCILCWIVLLPFYLARRHRSMKYYRS